MAHIRKEKPADADAIRMVNEDAFGRHQEANLIESLREGYRDILSLVAEDNGNIIGHALFTPVTIGNAKNKISGMGLGPMAVLPSHQQQGIGTQLIEYGIKELKSGGVAFIIVIGHTEYYQKFGFEPASRYKIKSQWKDVPDEVFMILWLDKSMIDNASGIARYMNEFNEVMQ